jgi:hypothetical protein
MTSRWRSSWRPSAASSPPTWSWSAPHLSWYSTLLHSRYIALNFKSIIQPEIRGKVVSIDRSSFNIEALKFLIIYLKSHRLLNCKKSVSVALDEKYG